MSDLGNLVNKYSDRFNEAYPIYHIRADKDHEEIIKQCLESGKKVSEIPGLMEDDKDLIY